MYSRRQILLAVSIAEGVRRAGTQEQNLRVIERRVFDAVNRERERAGRPKLTWDDRLAAIARRHAENMARRNFFAHNDPVSGGPERRITAAGIAWRNCAENLALELGYDDPVREFLKNWLESAGHRRNLLNPVYTHTGIGVARREDGTLLIAQEFIRPAPANAPVRPD